VRDPSVWRAANGTYYIVYTNSPSGKTSGSFGVARSTNVNVNVAGTQLTWAPEFFIDADRSVKAEDLRLTLVCRRSDGVLRVSRARPGPQHEPTAT